jgi:hypothetical protein
MPSTSRRHIYVFDAAVPDLQVLIEAVGPGHPSILLNSARSGGWQLAKLLKAG